MTQSKLKKTTSTRDGFGQGLLEIAKANPKVVALSADLTESLRMTEFAQQHPDRFIQVGVAEQNLVGTAAGLALGGKIPFAASFAVFSPGRSWDQIRTSVAYSNLNVKIVGGHAGLTTGADGATHQALEDIALMRVLPNMKVVVPCDAEQARQAVLALADDVGPAYLRLSRPKTPTLIHNDNFILGKAQILRQGVDATIIACGELVNQAVQAANLLAETGKSIRVINMHTIKPLDHDVILKAAMETGIILTAEDHQVTGGLGSAVAEVLAQANLTQLKEPIKFKIVGVEDCFGESGQAEELLKKYQLDAASLVQQLKLLIR